MVLDISKIPSKIGFYLAGFVDGEGCFYVSLRPRSGYTFGWKVSLGFNVTQKDKVILGLIKRYLKCGSVRIRSDGIAYYEVNKFGSIVDNVIPFFKRFSFLSSKKKNDFSKFCMIAKMISNREHLDEDGIKKILKIRGLFHSDRRYSDAHILKELEKLKKSSETIRKTI